MKAAVFVGPGNLELQDLPDPHAGSGELVLKVSANTVCGTDGRILRGEKTAGIDVGVVLGHEISGHVIEVGCGVDDFRIGDLVSVLPSVSCGSCYFCKHERENLCQNTKIFGYKLNGGLAEYVKIPRSALRRGGVYRVPNTVAPVEAALAEPLGCVLNGAGKYRPWLGDTALIIGAGPIGLLHVQVCRAFSATNVIVSDPSESRRRMAERCGANLTVDPTKVDLRDFVLEHSDGLGADVTVICIGAPKLFQDALTATRKGGHINAFAGFSKTSLAEIDPNLIHYGEIEVTGTSNARRADQELALKLINSGVIDVKSLHTHTFSLDKVKEGIAVATNGEGIKVAIQPGLPD